MSQIRVEVTDSREHHCFRLVFKTRLSPDAPADQEIEIMLHATSLVELIHSASTALCQWQHETTNYLIERLSREGAEGPMVINIEDTALGKKFEEHLRGRE